MRINYRILIPAVAIAAGLLLERACRTDVPRETVRAELRRLPPPPQTRLVNLHESRKRPKIFADYDAPLTRQELGRHYTAAATRAGWHPCGEEKILDWGRDLGDRSFRFIKGELAVVVFVAADPKVYGYRYQVFVGVRDLYPWESRGC